MLGFLIWLYSSKSATLNADKFRVKFVHPTTGEVVRERINARGTIGITPPEGYSLWIIRRFGEEYFPEKKQVSTRLKNLGSIRHICWSAPEQTTGTRSLLS